jgi:hypothetical protein
MRGSEERTMKKRRGGFGWKMRQTKNCVVCLEEKAVIWSGYVEKHNKNGVEDILAGFCKSCYPPLEAFMGVYHRKMKVILAHG